jgi:hypothetical protein
VRSVQVLATRWIAAARLVGDQSRVARLAAAALVVQAGYALAGVALIAAIAPWLAGALGATGADAATIAWYWSLAAVRLSIVALTGTYAALASGSDESAAVPAVRAVTGLQTLFEVVVAVFVVAHGLPLPWLAGLEVMAAALGAWLLRELVRVQHGSVPAFLRTLDAATARPIAAAPWTSPAPPHAPLHTLDVAVMACAGVIGLGPAVAFAASARAVRLMAHAAAVLGRQFAPNLETHALSLGFAAARDAVRRAVDAGLIVSVGLGVLLAAFATPAARLWLELHPIRAEVDTSGMALGLLLAVTPIASTGAAWFTQSALGLPVALCLLVETVASVPGVLIGVGWSGLTGAAWAIAAVHGVTVLWFVPISVGLHLRLQPLAFAWGRLWRALVVAVPVAASALVLACARPPRSGRELAIQVGIAATLHAVTGFAGWFLLQPREGMDQD